MELTDKRAKPAAYFGDKSRIIDFALSNALNSGLRRICIATQDLPDEEPIDGAMLMVVNAGDAPASQVVPAGRSGRRKSVCPWRNGRGRRAEHPEGTAGGLANYVSRRRRYGR
jgi:hypothetical protein